MFQKYSVGSRKWKLLVEVRFWVKAINSREFKGLADYSAVGIILVSSLEQSKEETLITSRKHTTAIASLIKVQIGQVHLLLSHVIGVSRIFGRCQGFYTITPSFGL